MVCKHARICPLSLDDQTDGDVILFWEALRHFSSHDWVDDWREAIFYDIRGPQSLENTYSWARLPTRCIKRASSLWSHWTRMLPGIGWLLSLGGWSLPISQKTQCLPKSLSCLQISNLIITTLVFTTCKQTSPFVQFRYSCLKPIWSLDSPASRHPLAGGAMVLESCGCH